MPTARPLPLHHGLAVEEAARYAVAQAAQRRISLTWKQAREIARAADGHPLLVEHLVAQAQRRDLDTLLDEVAERRGDFAAQVETTYTWCAARLDETGRAAWAALPLFAAGNAPEGPLQAAAGERSPQALRDAAVADFDPSRQVWRWHATVAEYARAHWPLSREERRARLAALVPAWTRWLKQLRERGGVALAALEVARPNLEDELDACRMVARQQADAFLEALESCLPPPDRPLALCELIAAVYYARLEMTPEEQREEGGRLLSNLGVALSALGQREAALAAAREAVSHYRTLAEANPQAFLPNLARSPGVYGSALRALGQPAEAADACAEGLRHLASFYRALPQAFAGLAAALWQVYLDACREAGQQPDATLLALFT